MFKEIFIAIYLLSTKIIFNLAKLFPKQNKYVFVSSFGDNTEAVAREVLNELDGEVIILLSQKSKYSFEDLHLNDNQIIPIDSFNIFQYIKSLFHLATAKIVIVDNYFAFLSVMNFKSGVECIQLWHAAGAVKKFGMHDPSFYERSNVAQKRFVKVYDRFDKVVVGSDEMVTIFKAAFNLTDDRFLKTGIPRTDFFFDEDAMAVAKISVLQAYPMIENKRVVMYAPTFRRNQFSSQVIAIDVKKMADSLGPDYVLLIRMHPAVKVSGKESQLDGVIDVSGYPYMNELLVVTDYLISDYSSLLYEFALLNKPQIFFPYDLEAYEQESGFWDAYENVVPGPIVQSTDQIIELISKDEFDLDRLAAFSKRWNSYSKGFSSNNLLTQLQKKEI